MLLHRVEISIDLSVEVLIVSRYELCELGEEDLREAFLGEMSLGIAPDDWGIWAPVSGDWRIVKNCREVGGVRAVKQHT